MTKCKTCHGYGLWTVGMHLPMEKEHFDEGMPNKVCPECGAGKREPIKEIKPSNKVQQLMLEEDLLDDTKTYDIPLELKVEALCNTIKRTVMLD